MLKSEKIPVRAGFIGVGNFITGHHLPNMAGSSLWEIYGICDLDIAKVEHSANQYHPKVFTQDYRDLLTDPEVEVVFIGTRHDMHEKLTVEAAAAGKDIFVEKPMSKSRDESRRMVSAVQSAGTRLMVGYNRRFAPSMIRAKDTFQARNRGKPALITYRVVDDARLWPSWPMDPKIGGGKVLSECCHFFDLLCWFLEAEPVQIQCCGERGDNNMIQMLFPNGTIACVISGGRGSAAFPKERMEVFCDSSTLVLDMFLSLDTSGYEGVEDEAFNLYNDPYPDITGSTPQETFRLKSEKWRKEGISEEDFARKAYHGTHPTVNKGHFAELEAYARAIRADEPSPCDEIDGARATAIALKAIESLEKGGVPMALSPEDCFLSERRL
jgi:predicted dehydrogenase